MKVKVIQGSIKFNDTIYEEGQTVELPENEALSIIKAGNAEEFVQESAQDKKARIKAEKAEVKKAEKVKKAKEADEVKDEAEKVKVEPTLDWTRPELDDFAKAQGIKEPEKLANKEKLLEVILKGGEAK